MASIKFGLWDDILWFGKWLPMHYAEGTCCIRQGGIKTRAAHEPLGTLQT